MDLYTHVRASVQSLEAGSRKVDALDGLLRSLEGTCSRTARPSLATWLQRLALDSREEEDPSGEGGITLMTLHAAKGLEFPVVFLVGVEEDYLPCAGIQGEARDLDEERRLAYVGITRARERLYLTRAAARTKRGKLLPRTPSRFLDDLPAGAHEQVDPEALPAPQEVAAHTESVMASLRARLGASAVAARDRRGRAAGPAAPRADRQGALALGRQAPRLPLWRAANPLDCARVFQVPGARLRRARRVRAGRRRLTSARPSSKRRVSNFGISQGYPWPKAPPTARRRPRP